MSTNLKKYLGIFLACYIVFFFTIDCNGQDYKYVRRTVPTSYLSQKSSLPKLSLSAFIDAEKYLPQGYTKNGTVDYTSYLQKALDENRNVIMPNFPILINMTGLSLKSNSKIYFRPYSKLILQPNGETVYHMILIRNAVNVQIFNPRIFGDKKSHTGSKGEWGMGISIYSSKNVDIYNPLVEECWGDGIYVGRQPGNINNQNINIYSAQLHENRRNGISIISGVNVLLDRPVVSNTNGILPMCGIVLEPNDNNDQIDNVTINYAKTFNNRYGIVVYLYAMQGKQAKDVNVVINSPLDQYSLHGLEVSGFDLKAGSKPISGTVRVIKPIWKNNQKQITKYNNPNLPKVLIQ
ncbi:hypothetical protein ACLCDV_00805 [Sphingobacterium sp. Lzh-3]|uniref:hypothetical protein n=1 Tax=Sphingobacterium sp. Lzh-3 TaxID=3382150 RepID=UPI00398CA684